MKEFKKFLAETAEVATVHSVDDITRTIPIDTVPYPLGDPPIFDAKLTSAIIDHILDSELAAKLTARFGDKWKDVIGNTVAKYAEGPKPDVRPQTHYEEFQESLMEQLNEDLSPFIGPAIVGLSALGLSDSITRTTRKISGIAKSLNSSTRDEANFYLRNSSQFGGEKAPMAKSGSGLFSKDNSDAISNGIKFKYGQKAISGIAKVHFGKDFSNRFDEVAKKNPTAATEMFHDEAKKIGMNGYDLVSHYYGKED